MKIKRISLSIGVKDPRVWSPIAVRMLSTRDGFIVPSSPLQQMPVAIHGYRVLYRYVNLIYIVAPSRYVLCSQSCSIYTFFISWSDSFWFYFYYTFRVIQLFKLISFIFSIPSINFCFLENLLKSILSFMLTIQARLRNQPIYNS